MANMCVNASGYKEAEGKRFDALKYAATLKATLAAVIAVDNANTAKENYDKLRSITSLGLRLEEEQHAHVKNTYWPAEEQMLNEFTQPRAWDSQSVLSKRYAGKMWAPMAAQFAREIRKLECEKPRYCGNAFLKRMQELQVQRAATRSNVTLLAERIAFYEIEAIKETDHERRKQVIALRQGLLTQAATFMAQAAAGFGGAQANALGALNNAIQTLGMAFVERNQAQAGVGRDPGFHSRVAQNLANNPNVTAGDMYGFAPVGANNQYSNPEYAGWQGEGSLGTIATPEATTGASIGAGLITDSGVVVTPIDMGSSSSPIITNAGVAPE